MTITTAGSARTDLLGEAIDRANGGDRDAIQFLYIRYADGVHACIERIVHDPHQAEKLTQTVFLKLARVIHRSRGLPFVAWINQVARKYRARL